MSISYRKHDGKWEYRIKFIDPFTRKPREKSKRGFDTKPEARHAAQEREKKLLEGLESNDHTTLKHFLKEWLIEYKKPLVRKNTFILHERNIDKHIVPYFKDLILSELKPLMYQKFLNHLKDQGYSKRTVEIIHGTVYSAMEKAVTLYKIEKNPCSGAEITTTTKRDKKSSTKEKLEYMESGNIPIFLKNAYQYGYIYWIFFKILLETGMRKGEAAALQWTDIDLKEGLININKTLDFQANSDAELFGETKTFSSERTITIRKSVVNDLRFHMNYQNQNKTTLNDMYRHDLNLVLCKNDGSPMPKSTLFNALERILKRANLPQIPIHALRDTHAVLLLEAEAELRYVQKRLGHKNYQTTVDIYSHISKKIEKDTLDKYEDHMDSVLK
jgi:integrase